MKGRLYIHCVNNNHIAITESTFASVQAQVKASNVKWSKRQGARILSSLLLQCQTVFQETLEDIDKNGDGFVDQDEYIGKCW